MWVYLIIAIALIFLFSLIYRGVKNIPIGVEDENGFHYITEEEDKNGKP